MTTRYKAETNRQEAKRLQEQGFNLREIGERFGVTPSAVCHMLKRKQTYPNPGPRTKLAQMLVDILAKSNITIKELADDFGVALRTLESWIHSRREPKRYLLKAVEAKYREVFGNDIK